MMAAKELGRIEATLDAPKPRTQSKAPPPAKTVNGGRSLATKNPDDMTMDEWLAWRETNLGIRKKA